MLCQCCAELSPWNKRVGEAATASIAICFFDPFVLTLLYVFSNLFLINHQSVSSSSGMSFGLLVVVFPAPPAPRLQDLDNYYDLSFFYIIFSFFF